jgi:hypothetical protein
MIRLFHRTTREAVASILAEGFRDGEDGVVWFSPALDCMGEQGRYLLEVRIDLTNQELAEFAAEVQMEKWDEVTDSFIPSDKPSPKWFQIPASIINARGSVRLVPPTEIPDLDLTD